MFAIANSDAETTDVWHALADPIRRSLIDRLTTGSKTTSQLCEGMPMTRFGVMKHIGILERAGLIIARKQGRFRVNHLNVAKLHSIHSRWISKRGEQWAESAAKLSATLGNETMTEKNEIPEAGTIELALEWPINASIQRTWAALFDQPEAWWPHECRAVGDGAKMKLDCALGGQLTEKRADGGGVCWYTIFALEPMKSVDLIGHLAARYGGPATSTLNIELAPGAADQTCILKLTDSIVGRIGPNMTASVSSGWHAIIGEGLVKHLTDSTK